MYLEDLCREENFAPAEVMEVLKKNLFSPDKQHGERNTAIMRDLVNGLAIPDIADNYHLSPSRVSAIEVSSRVKLRVMIYRWRKRERCAAIEDYETLAEVLECDEGIVKYVMHNATACEFNPIPIQLTVLNARMEGLNISEIANDPEVTEEDVKDMLVSVVDDLKNACDTMVLASTKWNSERSIRSPERLYRQWGVSAEDVKACMATTGETPEISDRGKALLLAWIEGKSAEDTVKSVNIVYSKLNSEFASAWRALRSRLQALKMERMRAEVRASSQGVSNLNLK